jgi:predicted nucleotide-binding protein
MAIKLLVPAAEASTRIQAQIEKGMKIVKLVEEAQGGLGFAEEHALARAKVEVEKWHKFTIDLLKMLFAEIRIDREFGLTTPSFSGVGQSNALMGWMSERMHRLDSLIERLPLFSSADAPVQAAAVPRAPSKDVFIVHGHDDAAKHEVARFLELLGLRPIILHERPDSGRTIIEKFEAHSNVGFAVILLTPDDIGYPSDAPGMAQPRARQNVLFELGFFIGNLGRSRVCVLRKGEIETPTDYSGVLYKTMDKSGAWKLELAKEIKQAGIDVDLNKAF